MDGRGDGDNGSATSTAEGSSSRQGGMERCSQSCQYLSPGDVCVPMEEQVDKVNRTDCVLK